jgi:hypothetical protein
MRRISRRFKNILYLSSLCLALIPMVYGVYYAGHRLGTSDGASDTRSIVEKWLVPCKQQKCINTSLQKITAKYGTQKALDSLQYYVDKVPDSLKGDNHLRAHYIGYQSLKSFGMTGQAFLECTIIYDYGCMHGFIEQMIWDGMTPGKTAEKLCRPVESSQSYSSNMKYYCYHGIGHGVLDYYDYDLTASLQFCDTLASQLGQTGCWQGVFMENVSAYTIGEKHNGTFSKTDPLAPCDVVEAKYQRECYINQEGYLFSFYDWDAGKAAYACLGAGEQIGTCMEGIGLAASSVPWQHILLKDKITISLGENAWMICQKFPAGYVTGCVTGAVTQILENDGVNFKQAANFCAVVDSASNTACYRRIGEYTRLQVADRAKAAAYCGQLVKEWRQICRLGAEA